MRQNYYFCALIDSFMGKTGFWLLWIPFLTGVSGDGIAQVSATRQAYILQYKNIAIDQMRTYGIPASITLAQACLETGFGTSRLAREAHNHFGIKCHSDWKGATIKQDDETKNECFRKYRNAQESFKDYAAFLRFRDRYAFLFDLSPYDYTAWAQGLKKAGYATDPRYAESLIKIIEDYSLYQYDRAVSSTPASPSVLEQPLVVHPDLRSPLYSISLYRTIYQRNRVSCIISQPGDSYASLAREFRLFKGEILRFNDLSKEEPLSPGTIVYVAKKRKQSIRKLPVHVADEGERLRDISQKYGVRLSSICKYNKINQDEYLTDRRVILLRRP